jgi:minor extracellular serine protease Vpr
VPFAASPAGGGSVSGGAAYGDFPEFGDVSASYARTTPLNGCTSISEDLTGKIALIDRGVCTFGTKVRNAAAKGAIGVLVANNVAGDPVAMGSDGGAMPVPAAMVSKNDGVALGGSGEITIDGDNVTEIKTGNAGIIAGFSSRGPTPFTYLIKPDLTAPGVNVYSSVFDGLYAMFQGTSMATPHLAGSAALLLQLHPDWSPDDVKSALVNTAKRPVFDHVTGEAPTGVLTRGGGRADLAAANATPVLISPASASFGYFKGNAQANGTLALTLRAAELKVPWWTRVDRGGRP